MLIDSILTVPCQHDDVTISVTGPIAHRCPYRDEIDRGTITITWQTFGETFEFHSLAEYLAKFALLTISHEALTDAICSTLIGYPGIEEVTVSTRWATAGLDIQVKSDSE